MVNFNILKKMWKCNSTTNFTTVRVGCPSSHWWQQNQEERFGANFLFVLWHRMWWFPQSFCNRRCETWVLYVNMETNNQAMECSHTSSLQKPLKCRQTFSLRKIMTTVLLGKKRCTPGEFYGTQYNTILQFTVTL